MDISSTLRPECRTLMLKHCSQPPQHFVSRLFLNRVLSHYQLTQIRAILGLSNSDLLMFWPFQFKVPTLLLFVRLKEREAQHWDNPSLTHTLSLGRETDESQLLMVKNKDVFCFCCFRGNLAVWVSAGH